LVQKEEKVFPIEEKVDIIPDKNQLEMVEVFKILVVNKKSLLHREE
jgi:hypothetical protein